MAYAAVTDMVRRFGMNEMIRLSTADGEALDSVNSDTVLAFLTDSSALIDSYLRKRYLVPVTEVLPELNWACCMMARHDMSMGGDREPPEQTRLARKEAITWLESVRDGKTVLDGAIPSGTESNAVSGDRGFTTYADDGDPTGANVFSGPTQPPNAGYFENWGGA